MTPNKTPRNSPTRIDNFTPAKERHAYLQGVYQNALAKLTPETTLEVTDPLTLDVLNHARLTARSMARDQGQSQWLAFAGSKVEAELTGPLLSEALRPLRSEALRAEKTNDGVFGRIATLSFIRPTLIHPSLPDFCQDNRIVIVNEGSNTAFCIVLNYL